MISVNLKSTIEAAIETVRLAAEAKTIQIQTMFESTSVQVLGDTARLQQIIWNLLSNAVKFTPIGGQVQIRLQVGTQVQIHVSDTGRGIAADFLPHVFDYFRQADSATTRTFGGLGLGLAIVRHLVELHGGTVQANSLGEGQGATFTVNLPLLSHGDRDRESAQNHAALTPNSLPLHAIRILIVDDEADTRELIRFILEQAGAIVISAASATEALQSFMQTKPDVVVSDVGMPEMDGYMLMQQVRAMLATQRRQIPAIALTAYAGEIHYRQAIAAGFQRHLTKPVEPEELVKTVISLVASRSVG